MCCLCTAWNSVCKALDKQSTHVIKNVFMLALYLSPLSLKSSHISIPVLTRYEEDG